MSFIYESKDEKSDEKSFYGENRSEDDCKIIREACKKLVSINYCNESLTIFYILQYDGRGKA